MYVARVFEPRIEPQDSDGARLLKFVSDLVSLDRHTYKAVMRAVRRYVNGLHRIADDLDLAYALLVASIESLGQDFDAFTPTWEDFEQRKRVALDRVLDRASTDVAADVRNVLLAHEHLALARRYREFALEHLSPSFFREEAVGEPSPVRRSDLPKALEQAYVFRSKYVHRLLELPRYITGVPSKVDTVRVEGKPTLTFHGLARIARHIISEFVARAPKCERETLDYRKELPNTFRAPLAFTVWGNRSSSYDHKSARRYLGGFLQEVTPTLTSKPFTTVVPIDVRPLVKKVETLVPSLARAEQRLPLLTLYFLFHHYFSPTYHQPDYKQFFDKYIGDFASPSIESMLFHVLRDNKPEWTLEEFETLRCDYFKQRYTKNGLEVGATLEVALTLFSAEMHRREGHEEQARELVSEAVENLPGRTSLLDFELRMAEVPLPAISWKELLLPALPQALPEEQQSS
ncbi:hypothetical protein [Leptolyngbya sp. FACHB-261]|uniref:hypothetical protein n=1 Tax=Leptolyngbya sp. FACHB-261 TaxID=2692806 RepID=UPI00168783DF|nr:hypothetical protein [Leptolyngbya sp. FACHB-261]